MERNSIIIYSNYKRSNKWMGIIDYKILAIAIIYCFCIILILDFLNFNIKISFYIFCFFSTPVIVILIISAQRDNGVLALYMILKFIFNNKIYVKMKYYKKLNKYELYK